MTKHELIGAFREWQERLASYRFAMAMLEVDAYADPPAAGADYRGVKRAVLAGEYRRVLMDEHMYAVTGELADLLGVGVPRDGAEAQCPSQTGAETAPERASETETFDEGDLAREVQLVLGELEKDRAVPREAFVRYEKALDISRREWLRARQEKDFAGYAPFLQKLVDAWLEITALRGGSGSLYDRMLDGHQPGWNTERYDRFFAEIRKRAVPLLREIGKAEPISTDFLHRLYPAEGQRRVMRRIADYLGFTEDWGKFGESAHPLTTGICRGDVRFTTKYRERDAAQGILSTVHETGHAWFFHNIAKKYEGTAIESTISAGLHESQSRLCENHFGRSLPFWQVIFPFLQAEFPEQLSGIDAERFYRAVNAVQPSPVRIEADEVTYPLHIMIRYELEKELLNASLPAADLEQAWNEKYREYLGIVPKDAAEGVLQDMHWPCAYFGYFPTYALGSAMAAQVYETLARELDVSTLLLERRFPELMQWLEARLQRFGNRYPAEELIRRVTGAEFSAEAYCGWLEKKYCGLYGICPEKLKG